MQTQTAPDYNTTFDPKTGQTVVIAPGIRRIVAPNASPYTFTGTNSYVVGFDDVVVIDPGPEDQNHKDALIRAVGDANCVGIVLTHTHRDHSALAPALGIALNAPLIFEGEHRPSRKMSIGEKDPLKKSGHYGLKPNRVVVDQTKIDLGEIDLIVHTTPGHCANHIAISISGSKHLFTGDHIMGWSSTLIADPDGSLEDYFKSLQKVLDLDADCYLPAHGEIIKDGHAFAKQLLAHRHSRNHQIIAALIKKPKWTLQLLAEIYKGIPLKVKPAALLTLNAHLHYLVERGDLGINDFRFAKQYYLVEGR